MLSVARSHKREQVRAVTRVGLEPTANPSPRTPHQGLRLRNERNSQLRGPRCRSELAMSFAGFKSLRRYGRPRRRSSADVRPCLHFRDKTKATEAPAPTWKSDTSWCQARRHHAAAELVRRPSRQQRARHYYRLNQPKEEHKKYFVVHRNVYHSIFPPPPSHVLCVSVQPFNC
ncbi:unnamed protein product [Scytosiphon promiscuus]